MIEYSNASEAPNGYQQCAQQGDRWASTLSIREREHRRESFIGQAEEKKRQWNSAEKEARLPSENMACWLNRVKMEFWVRGLPWELFMGN